MTNDTLLYDIGLVDYQTVWDYQLKLFDQIVGMKQDKLRASTVHTTPNVLIWVSHPHVYTLGKSGDATNMLVSEDFLKSKGATLVAVDRGGDITYHGPGQLVGYPIIDLDNFGLDIKGYIHKLEAVIIALVASYGIVASRDAKAIGVWIDQGKQTQRKICAIGVRCSRHVTMHGFALNMNTDLAFFDFINPCGFTDKGATSLAKELGRKIDENEVKDRITKLFAQEFGMNIVQKEFTAFDKIIVRG
jgi:lipoyl(octanoyl) transferase